MEGPVPELAPGQVLFRVDRFALTANNITYAVAGDVLGYWRFFPCEAGWGRIPVMGFADVIRSTHPEVEEGTRCFGFYPMGRHLVIQPGAVSAAQIVDAAPHRAGLAPTYAQYLPTTGDAVYAEKREDQILLMRGLFMTSFLADDFLAEQGYRGARSVLISSASSKTSIALAFQVKQGGRARAIGLTSARNAEFVRRLGCYDEVVLYDEVASLAQAARGVRGHGRRRRRHRRRAPPLRRRAEVRLHDRRHALVGRRARTRPCRARSRSSSSRPRRS